MFYLLGWIGRWLTTPDELRDDNFVRLYAGQDRSFGSKEANDKLRQKVAEQGLSGEVLLITHHASRATGENTRPEPAARVAESIKQNGYRVTINAITNEELRFETETKIDSMVFDRKTAELNDFLYEFGWQYGGWNFATAQKERSE